MTRIERKKRMKRATCFVKCCAALLLAAVWTAHAQEVPTTIEQVNTTPGEVRGSVKDAHWDIPAGLACELPFRWSNRVNHPFPRIPLIVSQDMVYTSSSSVNAINRATGKRAWYFTPPGEFIYEDIFNANGVSALKLDGNVLYFGGYQKTLFALDATTGKELWNYPLGRHMLESIENDTQRVYVGTSRVVYAINKKDGTLAWQMDIPSREKEGQFNPLKLANGTVYVVSGKAVYALDARTGKEVWTYRPIGDGVRANSSSPMFVYSVAPVIHGQQIVVQEYVKDGERYSTYLTGIGLKTGTPQWRYKPRYLYPVMTVTPDDKILMTSGSSWSQYNITDNKMDWYFGAFGSAIARPPAVVGNLALFGTESQYIFAINRDTGKEVFRFAFPEDAQGVRNIVIDNGELFFLGGDGRVYAYEFKCPQIK